MQFNRFADSPVLVRFGSIAAGLAALCIVETIHVLEQQSQHAQAQAELIQRAGALRARLEGALNGVLYLDSGLVSYLVTRRGVFTDSEVNTMLSILHNRNPHVRNFGIAIGYRVTNVYPPAGNEKAIGLDYRTIPAQLEQVKRTVDSQSPVLTGPLQLVQGGNAVIHRTPIFIDHKFWGLVSTVVDIDSIYRTAGLANLTDGYSYALRGRNGLGAQGEVFFGDSALFGDPLTVTMPIAVSGGQWVLAAKPPVGDGYGLGDFLRVCGWALSLLLAYLTYLVLHHRNELARLALYDGLTGVPNRQLLRDRIDQAIFRASRIKSGFSIVFVDLDRFKLINDGYGHEAGDVVLKTIAERLVKAIRTTDTVARWGGDEMVLVLDGVSADEARRLRQIMLAQIEKPIIIGAQSLQIGASFGIAAYPADGDTLDKLLKVADARMYSDKVARKKSLEPASRRISRVT
jgi:diguanylate cyclase (GGDEF)-like protein